MCDCGRVFAIHFEHMGKEHRVASPAVLLMARANSRPTQTRAESPQRPVALWSPTMSQNHQATPKRLREQVASLRATATRCCSRRLRLRGLRFFLMGLELWKHIVIQFRSKAFFFEKYLFLNLNRRYFHRGHPYSKRQGFGISVSLIRGAEPRLTSRSGSRWRYPANG